MVCFHAKKYFALKFFRKSLRSLTLDDDDLELIRENENLGITQSEKVNFCAIIFFVPFILVDMVYTYFVDHVLFH